MKVFLLIVVLFSTVLTTDFQQFKNIEQNQLGKTLIDTIAVQISSGEPMDALFETLFNIQQRQQDDYKEDDTYNKEFQAKCEIDLTYLAQDDANSRVKINELQLLIENLTPMRDQQIQELKSKSVYKDQVQVVIDNALQQRSQQSQFFEQSRVEYQTLNNLLSDGKHIITNSLQQQSPNFLQVSEQSTTQIHSQIMAQVTTHFQNNQGKLNKLTHNSSIGKAIKMLAQLTSRTRQVANQEISDRVIKSIDDLQGQLSQAFDLQRKAEDDRMNYNAKYISILQADVNKYNYQISAIQSEIASLNDKITMAQGYLNDNNLRMNDKKTQYEDRKQECNDALNDFQQRSQLIQKDIQTVNNLISLLDSQARELKQYIDSRIVQGDKFNY